MNVVRLFVMRQFPLLQPSRRLSNAISSHLGCSSQPSEECWCLSHWACFLSDKFQNMSWRIFQNESALLHLTPYRSKKTFGSVSCDSASAANLSSWIGTQLPLRVPIPPRPSLIPFLQTSSVPFTETSTDPTPLESPPQMVHMFHASWVVDSRVLVPQNVARYSILFVHCNSLFHWHKPLTFLCKQHVV